MWGIRAEHIFTIEGQSIFNRFTTTTLNKFLTRSFQAPSSTEGIDSWLLTFYVLLIPGDDFLRILSR